jgi:hypothetical protein
MSSIITRKLLHKIGYPNLVEVLTDKLSGTELNTLLLEVLRERTKRASAPGLLKQYQINRFVKPGDLPVLELKEIEVALLRLFKQHSFHPVDLSPVSILGSCSVVGPVDQNKVLSGLRGTEVLADATNAMALHICELKKRKVWAPVSSEKIHFSAIQRHVRTQPITGSGFRPHFKIGCFVTSGLDTGNFRFEKEALFEHMRLMNAVFRNFYHVDDLSFRLLCREGYPDALHLANDIKQHVGKQLPDVSIEIVPKPEKEIGYYKGVQYKVDIRWKDNVYEIADGGFVDWTQQMLENKKERFLISGFGFDFMWRIMKSML